MARIEKAEYQKRLDRITELFTTIVAHADCQSSLRCPYKNRHDQCTAGFGCRNKRKPRLRGELPICAGDDKLDYRKAWQTD
jgi:hypothetical protein